MAESFEEKLDRLADQLARSSEEFDRRLAESRAESRAEHQRRMAEAEERWGEHQRWKAELDKQWAEHQRKMAEADERWKESRAEHQRWKAELDKQWAEHQRWMAEAEERWGEHQRWMEQADKRWGDIANVQGEIAEDLFRRNASAALRSYGIRVDDVYTNLKVPGIREYDIVLVNGSEAVVLEIKNKLRGADISKFLHTQLPQFKTAFPRYEQYKVYGGIGALVMSREQEAAVSEAGLFVLTQGEDGAARLKEPETLHVW